jgi:hypothetical protein
MVSSPEVIKHSYFKIGFHIVIINIDKQEINYQSIFCQIASKTTSNVIFLNSK